MKWAGWESNLLKTRRAASWWCGATMPADCALNTRGRCLQWTSSSVERHLTSGTLGRAPSPLPAPALALAVSSTSMSDSDAPVLCRLHDLSPARSAAAALHSPSQTNWPSDHDWPIDLWWYNTRRISYTNSSNYSLYSLICWHITNHCCLLRNDFCSPLDVTATNKLS